MSLRDLLRRVIGLTDQPQVERRPVRYTVGGRPFDPMNTPETPAGEWQTDTQARAARTWTSEDLEKFLAERLR